ncbi:C13 family peptidase [Sphingorhabdus sp.]|uniref:C13 family peptidase n=1 Tax=Sphingorhabdus sp. TaxID=1902408 RepID=UPI00391CE34B
MTWGNAKLRLAQAGALALSLLVTGSAFSQQPVFNTAQAAKNGWFMEQNRSASWYLSQHKKMASAITALQPQKPGIVDAYVISIGLDSDPVFARESAEAAKVLARRYGATGRTLYLTAGADDKAPGVPQGSPSNLATALAAVADRMDEKEDVLILFATTHGDPVSGLAYRDGEDGVGMIAPQRLSDLLDSVGIKRRMILLSACYSGIFIPLLTNDETVIVTAASSQRTSFGCAPGNDWTFFGDALMNNAFRKPQKFDDAMAEAVGLISEWEGALKLTPSRPQVFVGDNARLWLDALELKMPRTPTARVGRPAIDSG